MLALSRNWWWKTLNDNELGDCVIESYIWRVKSASSWRALRPADTLDRATPLLYRTILAECKISYDALAHGGLTPRSPRGHFTTAPEVSSFVAQLFNLGVLCPRIFTVRLSCSTFSGFFRTVTGLT